MAAFIMMTYNTQSEGISTSRHNSTHSNICKDVGVDIIQSAMHVTLTADQIEAITVGPSQITLTISDDDMGGMGNGDDVIAIEVT
jgi:hypothetical protein